MDGVDELADVVNDANDGECEWDAGWQVSRPEVQFRSISGTAGACWRVDFYSGVRFFSRTGGRGRAVAEVMTSMRLHCRNVWLPTSYELGKRGGCSLARSGNMRI